MKVTAVNQSATLIDDDGFEARIPNDIAAYLMKLGAHAQRAKATICQTGWQGDPAFSIKFDGIDPLAILRYEAERKE